METTKETGIKMKSFRKAIALIVLIFIIFIAGRRILRSCCAQYINNQFLCQILGIEKNETTMSDFAPLVTRARSDNDYNFARLAHLIEESIKVKQLFYTAYLEQPKYRKSIDIDAMKDLLSELYREKVRLESYIYYIKHNSQEGFIDKRKRSLYYFQKVLGKNIREIELILKKI